MDRLKQAADEQRRRRDAAPDTSGLGEVTSRTATTKTYRDTGEDGTVTSVMVTRGGTVLRVTGVCLDCVTGAADCDRCPPADEQPPDDEPPAGGQPQPAPVAPRPPAAPAAAEHPEPADTHLSGTTAPQLDPLDSIRTDRWSKSL